MYNVSIKRKVLKNAQKMPEQCKKKLAVLIKALQEKGPLQPNWPNFSKLGSNQYHCHLTYHWVACWSHTKNTVTIEVYYVGSRENAPY
jgi:mRNA-degrading endonuclease YafQ of YafQ-DinJ toxin-antitoxin module